MASCSSLFGLVRIACVRPGTLAVGVRDVVTLVSVSSGKCVNPVAPSSGLPTVNGVIVVLAITGAAAVNATPSRLTVVPCGMDPMRTTLGGSAGWVVLGTLIQTPGSKC